jgi:hypothetical protein
VSNLVILPIPDFPATMPSHVFFNPMPRGVTNPKPVTTTFFSSSNLPVNIFNSFFDNYFARLCLFLQKEGEEGP